MKISDRHLYRKVWTIVKLIYLHLAYFALGLDDQYFYIAKGNYFAELEWCRYAIPNYKKALKKSSDPLIHFWLGYCLLRLRKYNESLAHYRIAYEKIHDPNAALGLAIAEYETGNSERSRAIIQEAVNKDDQLLLAKNPSYLKLKGLLEKDSSQTRSNQEAPSDNNQHTKTSRLAAGSISIPVFGILSITFSLVIVALVALPSLRRGINSFNVLYLATGVCWFMCGIGIIKRKSWARRGLMFLAVLYLYDSLQQPARIIHAITASKWLGLSALLVGLIFFVTLLIFLSLTSIKQQFSKDDTISMLERNETQQ
jgi:tetratricopeptide (TPR) repeat protein